MSDGYEILAGAGDSPVILHVPHSSRVVPAWVRERIELDDADLTTELDRLTDSGTREAADVAAGASPAPWRFVNRLSRLVVDPERFPDDREELTAAGMAAVYLRTSQGEPLRDDDPAHREALLETYFRPYGTALAELVDDRIAATGRAVIVDVHSFPLTALPYELHAHARRPQVCLGTDSFHTPVWLLAAAKLAFAGFELARNEPFTGTYVPLHHFETDGRVASLMVELRRDVLADPAAAGRIAAALTELVTVAGTAPIGGAE